MPVNREYSADTALILSFICLTLASFRRSRSPTPVAFACRANFSSVDDCDSEVATTTFSGDHLWWIEGTTIPVIWKKRWNKGRVFYYSIGHTLDDLKIPQVTEIMRRGFKWAAGRSA